jgi:hypothetical protein
MEFKIEINDALASQIVREAADVAIRALENSSEMSKSFSTQGFLTTVGNIVKPIIQNVFQAENTSSIMPILLGMMMGNNGFSPTKTDSPSAAKEDPEKPEPTQTGVAMPAQPTQTQE